MTRDELRELLVEVIGQAATSDPVIRVIGAAIELDRAYGPLPRVGLASTVTQEMVDGWRRLQEALEEFRATPGGEYLFGDGIDRAIATAIPDRIDWPPRG